VKIMPPFREGFTLVLGNRELRSLAILPMILGFVAFVLIYVLAVWLLGGWVAHLIGSAIGRLGGQFDASVLGRVLVAMALLFVSQAIYLGSATSIAAPIWDHMTKRIEILKFGAVPEATVSLSRTGLEIAMRITFAIFVSLVALSVSWILAGIIAAFIAGCLALCDLTSPAFARRRVLFPRQLVAAFRLPGALPFALVAGAFAYIPLLNLFMLPGLLSTATLMVARAHPASNGNERT